MEKPIREAFTLLSSRIEHILLLGVTILVPFLAMHAIIANYIMAITPTFFGTTIIADIYNSFLTIFLLLFLQIPFIRYMFNEYQGNEGSLRNAYYYFFVNGFEFFVFAVVASLIATLGLVLFFIPGLIIITLLYPIPFIATMENKSVWKSVKSGLRLGRKHFFKLFILVFLFAFIELLISSGITLLIYSLTTSFAAQLLAHMFLNLLFFPIITLIISGYIIKWREEIYTIEKRETEEGWT